MPHSPSKSLRQYEASRSRSSGGSCCSDRDGRWSPGAPIMLTPIHACYRTTHEGPFRNAPKPQPVGVTSKRHFLLHSCKAACGSTSLGRCVPTLLPTVHSDYVVSMCVAFVYTMLCLPQQAAVCSREMLKGLHIKSKKPCETPINSTRIKCASLQTFRSELSPSVLVAISQRFLRFHSNRRETRTVTAGELDNTYS